MRKMMQKQDGFTLIELVVVVAILGILAVIVTPKVLGAMDNAKTNSAKSSAKQVQLGLERYYVTNSAYPSVEEFCGEGEDGQNCPPLAMKTLLNDYVNLDTNFTADYSVNAGSYSLSITYTGVAGPFTITPATITAPTP